MNIYLAGNDRSHFSYLLHSLKYPYRLCSYYYLMSEPNTRDILFPCINDGSEWIMDSGLFSLMFGTEQGKLTTYDDFRDYALKYMQAMVDWKWPHAIVECDVQRVLGVEETFRLREEIFKPSGFEVIYVWHVPEGEAGLAKLAATEKRIALSVPELRQVMGTGPIGGMKVRMALIHLLDVCRKAGPAKVHLLGCTEGALMRLPADSCDSTSWEAGRFGRGHIYHPMTGQLEQASIYSPKWQAYRKWMMSKWQPGFDQMKQYLVDKRQVLTDRGDDPKTNIENQFLYYSQSGVSALTFLMFMEAGYEGNVQRSQLQQRAAGTAGGGP